LFFESPEELEYCAIRLMNGWAGKVLLVFFLIPPFAFRKGSGGEGEKPSRIKNSVGRVDPLFWR